ncbi:MAG: hypothetical protein IPO58_03270 [Betaproteobacteria bacterium]|nr:hypothetical protein [Betaproteobacteria bacterium]
MITVIRLAPGTACSCVVPCLAKAVRVKDIAVPYRQQLAHELVTAGVNVMVAGYGAAMVTTAPEA